MLSFMQFLQSINGSDKTIHKAFRTHTWTLQTNPLQKFLIFTIYKVLMVQTRLLELILELYKQTHYKKF